MAELSPSSEHGVFADTGTPTSFSMRPMRPTNFLSTCCLHAFSQAIFYLTSVHTQVSNLGHFSTKTVGVAKPQVDLGELALPLFHG